MTERGKQEPALPGNPAEWITFAVSALLLAAVLGAVVWLWLEVPATGARFTVERGEVRDEGGRFALPVRVSNAGGAPATEVRVEGRLGDERPTAVVDFLPRGATEEVVLVFRADPAAADVGVASYQTDD